MDRQIERQRERDSVGRERDGQADREAEGEMR
jgi:hypothetical protein